ncbi:MAG: hypothetical protein NUW22_01165 [Acidobacteria bacterium]|nr:hypothetical protein [Acidobacteriota bacterium]
MQGTVTVEKTVSGEVIAEERRKINIWHCSSCGVLYGIDAEYITERQRDGKAFYCPNGCCRSYHETEADRLRKSLELERKAVARTQDMLNGERASHAATRGHLTRAKRRVTRDEVTAYFSDEWQTMGESGLDWRAVSGGTIGAAVALGQLDRHPLARHDPRRRDGTQYEYRRAQGGR